MNIHFILHEMFEVPGAYLKWAQDRILSHQSSVYEKSLFLKTVEGIDFLIVMVALSHLMRSSGLPYYAPRG